MSSPRWFKTFKTNFPKGNNSVFKWGGSYRTGLRKLDLFIIDYHLNSVNSRAMDGIKVMDETKDEHDTLSFFWVHRKMLLFQPIMIKYGWWGIMWQKIIRKHSTVLKSIGNVLHNTYLQRTSSSSGDSLCFWHFGFTLITGIMLTKFYPDHIWSMPWHHMLWTSKRFIYSATSSFSYWLCLFPLIPVFYPFSGAPWLYFSTAI